MLDPAMDTSFVERALGEEVAIVVDEPKEVEGERGGRDQEMEIVDREEDVGVEQDGDDHAQESETQSELGVGESYLGEHLLGPALEAALEEEIAAELEQEVAAEVEGQVEEQEEQVEEQVAEEQVEEQVEEEQIDQDSTVGDIFPQQQQYEQLEVCDVEDEDAMDVDVEAGQDDSGVFVHRGRGEFDFNVSPEHSDEDQSDARSSSLFART
jgi:exosome complex component RRP41